MNTKSLKDVIEMFSLDVYDIKTIEGLLTLNNGRLTAIALRAHLSRSYATCSRLLDVLVEKKLAQYAINGENMQYLESRERGWYKNV